MYIQIFHFINFSVQNIVVKKRKKIIPYIFLTIILIFIGFNVVLVLWISLGVFCIW